MGVGRVVRMYPQVYPQQYPQPDLRVRNEHNLDHSPHPCFTPPGTGRSGHHLRGH